MVAKYIQLYLLGTVVHISGLIGQEHKSLPKSKKWLITNPSVTLNRQNWAFKIPILRHRIFVFMVLILPIPG